MSYNIYCVLAPSFVLNTLKKKHNRDLKGERKHLSFFFYVIRRISLPNFSSADRCAPFTLCCFIGLGCSAEVILILCCVNKSGPENMGRHHPRPQEPCQTVLSQKQAVSRARTVAVSPRFR